MLGSIKLFFPLIFLYLFGCSNSTSSPIDNSKLIKIFDKTVNRIEIEYPYLYVAAWTDGLWRIKIDDGSNSIEKLMLPDSVDGISKVADVTVSGNDILVSTLTSIYHSLDDGKNWIQSTEGIPYISALNSIERFKSYPERIIAPQAESIYWSDNNAQNWHNSNINLPRTSSDTFIKIDPLDNGIAWIYGWDDLSFPWLCCISDHGKNLKHWVNLSDLFGFNYHLISIRDFVFDIRDNHILYLSVSTQPRFFKSKNGGYEWEPIESDSIYIHAFVQDTSSPNLFYAADLRSIYTSNDTLHTFQFVCDIGEPKTEENIIHQLIFENSNKLLYIATYAGVYSLSFK